MKLDVRFPGGMTVEADTGGHTVRTDQPEVNGGDGNAPSPFQVFLSSLATCAGFFALRFCQHRNIDTSGMGLTAHFRRDPETHMVSTAKFHLTLPDGFPEKYKKAILRTMDQCSVKKHLMDPPEFEMVAEQRCPGNLPVSHQS